MNRPLVSVILTHQLKVNWPYLKLAIEGLKNTRGLQYEVLIQSGQEETFDSSQMRYFLNLPAHYQFRHDPKLDTATKKIDAALKEVSSESTHLMLLSDDVIVSGNCIRRLYEASRGQEMIVGPMSNSDLGTRYDASMNLESDKFPLGPDMSLENLTSTHLREILSLETSTCINRLLIPFSWISFFCVMMPKSVWQRVGGTDPALEYRFNDQDFCMRAARMGIPTLINFAAFAFHFGSKTMQHLKTEKIDKDAIEHFVKKWDLK